MREIDMATAIREAMDEEMQRNPEVFLLGEDIGQYGGYFGVTRGLVDKYPDRVKDTPIAELGILGIALGSAYAGMHPVCEVGFADFLSIVFDYFVNQVTKVRYMNGCQEGGTSAGLVVRAPCGILGGGAGHHSQCMEPYFLPIPGLKIALPSTPYDAKGMLKYAIRGNDPVLFLEHKALYKVTGPVPEEDYTIPFASADVKRRGKDITVVATMSMVQEALAAAEALAAEGIDVEVVDPRSIRPLDLPTILQSVAKTGRLVLANEAPTTGNVMAEIGLRIVEEGFPYLKAAPVRVCGPDTVIPYSAPLEKAFLRTSADIIAGIRKVLA